MREIYHNYLQTEAWAQKRGGALQRAGGKCEACGTHEQLQVHHLTYARIYQENDADLMVLCRLHHEATEEMVHKGVLKRNGCVKALREKTLQLIAPLSHGQQRRIVKQAQETPVQPELPKQASYPPYPHAAPKPLTRKQIKLAERQAKNRLKKERKAKISARRQSRAVRLEDVPEGAFALKDVMALQTGKGGWKKEALAFLGVPWPPPKGWLGKITGKHMRKPSAPAYNADGSRVAA